MPAFDEQDYTKSFQWGIWKRLMPVMRPYRRDFAGMFAFNLITAAIDVVLPLFQRYAISIISRPDAVGPCCPTHCAISASSCCRPCPLWPLRATP